MCILTIESYILIGGESKRFGRDKATFEFNGETLAERAARIAEIAIGSKEVMYVAASKGQFLRINDRRIIYDIYPDRGPAGAIHAALSNAATPWIFVLAVDLPFVSVAFISYLKPEISERVDVVVPCQPDGRIQPLCAFYRVTGCLAAFENAAKNEGKIASIQEIIAGLNARLIVYGEYSHLPGAVQLLRNVNTPDDLKNI